MSRFSSGRQSPEKGAFLVELLLSCPLLLLLVFGSLETHSYLRVLQKLDQIKRIAIKTAFHSCQGEFGYDPDTPDGMRACVQDARVLASVAEQARIILPEVKVIYSYWVLHKGVIIKAFEVQGGTIFPQDRRSRSRIGKLVRAGQLNPVLRSTGEILVAEVYGTESSPLNIFNWFGKRGPCYEVGVI